MSTDLQHFAVDRIESAVAVLVSDSGRAFEIPTAILPKGIQEGSVIQVGKDDSGEVAWATAVLDEVEREARISRAEGVLNELRKRDPGGDIDI